MPRLYLVESKHQLGEITDEELAFLIEHLVAEGADDRAYYLDRATLEALAAAGCPPRVLGLLQQALPQAPSTSPYREPKAEESQSEEPGIEVGWEQEESE